jgi:tol-pal system protein YbgF
MRGTGTTGAQRGAGSFPASAADAPIGSHNLDAPVRMVLVRLNHTKPAMARLAFRASIVPAFAFVLTTAAIAAPDLARAQDSGGGLFDRIFGGSERLSGGGAERAAPSPALQDRTAQLSGSDLLLRLDRLEAQIRQLTGVVEQLQHRNHQLESYIRRTQDDSELRQQELGSRGAPRPALPPRSQIPSPQTVPAAPGAGRRGDAFDPSQQPHAPGVPQALGSPNSASQPPAAGNSGDVPIGAPGGRGPGTPLDLATLSPSGPPPGQPPRYPGAGSAHAATQPASQLPKDEFDLAYGYMLRKDYPMAEEGFRHFIGKHPTDRLAGDAAYWLGESFFQRQLYRDAAETFLNVSTKYESATKAPDALLRLGQSLAALGEKEAACASLGEVLRKYPRASAGVKQGVEREQKRVRC